MPGLIRGVARTAAIAGTATAVSGRVQRRQAERFAARDANIYAAQQQAYREQVAPAPPAPAPAPAAATPAPAPAPEDRIALLKELGELRDSGVLTEEEFAAEKAKVLR